MPHGGTVVLVQGLYTPLAIAPDYWYTHGMDWSTIAPLAGTLATMVVAAISAIIGVIKYFKKSFDDRIDTRITDWQKIVSDQTDIRIADWQNSSDRYNDKWQSRIEKNQERVEKNQERLERKMDTGFANINQELDMIIEAVNKSGQQRRQP